VSINVAEISRQSLILIVSTAARTIMCLQFVLYINVTDSYS